MRGSCKGCWPLRSRVCSLVLGKLCGGALLALTQAMLFLLAARCCSMWGWLPEMPLGFSIGQGLAMTGVLFLTGLGMAGLGFLFAWKIDSVQGFHGIMSVLLMPMWLLSGAFFPPATAAGSVGSSR